MVRKIKDIPLPQKIMDSKITKFVSCSGPIPCVSLQFENGFRLDIAVVGNPNKSHQIVPPEDNPYYNGKKK